MSSTGSKIVQRLLSQPLPMATEASVGIRAISDPTRK